MLYPMLVGNHVNCAFGRHSGLGRIGYDVDANRIDVRIAQLTLETNENNSYIVLCIKTNIYSHPLLSNINILYYTFGTITKIADYVSHS